MDKMEIIFKRSHLDRIIMVADLDQDYQDQLKLSVQVPLLQKIIEILLKRRSLMIRAMKRSL